MVQPSTRPREGASIVVGMTCRWTMSISFRIPLVALMYYGNPVAEAAALLPLNLNGLFRGAYGEMLGLLMALPHTERKVGLPS